ncbi:hypothetical protein DPEC_G00070840 [Dallia pectoralis]|uniref:Uncharacterized protein n=1 Tax=Dallia pectoralis TaxID=75939 RepID=A0ACC2H293_DALPE|nr:hypothetical protein DPEC_G00070840 [Dallia pectoralis]
MELPLFVYNRDQLIQLRDSASPAPRDIPAEIRKRRRGSRAGLKVKLRKRRFKPTLPSIVMGNVRSLENKMDELTALVRTQSGYRESSFMCFSETWLQDVTPDSAMALDGFRLVRADRGKQSGKKRGGGLAVFVNSRWCDPGHVTEKTKVCLPDIEVLAVGMHPYYMPREFSHVILLAVYIPPSADGGSACDVIHSITASLQTQHPDALFLISGDFNHVPLKRTLSRHWT